MSWQTNFEQIMNRNKLLPFLMVQVCVSYGPPCVSILYHKFYYRNVSFWQSPLPSDCQIQVLYLLQTLGGLYCVWNDKWWTNIPVKLFSLFWISRKSEWLARLEWIYRQVKSNSSLISNFLRHNWLVLLPS